jgi:hypothetical protein
MATQKNSSRSSVGNIKGRDYLGELALDVKIVIMDLKVIVFEVCQLCSVS